MRDMRRVALPRDGFRGTFRDVIVSRQCTRAACRQAAVSTLTYVYADSTVVLGPLAVVAEPHSYDLCEQHANGLTAPRGWEVVRLVVEPQPSGEPEAVVRGSREDDLTMMVEAVREVPQPRHKSVAEPLQVSEMSRRGHLRMLRGEGV